MKDTRHARSMGGSTEGLPTDGGDRERNRDDSRPRRDTDPAKAETIAFQGEDAQAGTRDAPPEASHGAEPTPEPDAPPEKRESRTFVPDFNSYQLSTLLGKGQFGEVWQAVAPGGVEVAVKIVPWPSAHRLSQMELRALELMKRVRHPFLIQMHAYWPMDNQVVVVMELADGSMEQRAKEYRKKGQPGIPREELVRYIKQAAEALDYLHSQDILHRDIKPANILLVGAHAKLGDFGIAKLFEAEAPQARQTIAGTPHFMAPEVWDSRASRESDQYSLAATYLDLRVGLPQSTLADLMSGNTGLQEVMAQLPADERRVLAQALSKDPTDRFASCQAMAEALAPAPRPVAEEKQGLQSQWRNLEISGSVGRGGENRPEDVGKVQSLLNLTGLTPALAVDSRVSGEMIKAITEFQYRHTLQQDGLIEPDGPTLRALNRAYKISDRPVPDHTLVKLLGYGAFGEVWLAETSSGVKKALKLIPLDRGSGWKEFKGVFRVRDIRNPCLVSITDVWLLDTTGKVLGKEDVEQLIKDTSSSMFGRGTIGIPTTKPKVLVVAMQLCDKSLYDVFKETGGKGIPKDKLLRYMEDAARGLDWLNVLQHQASAGRSPARKSSQVFAIRHCDVKPENIMVVGGGAQVCDFGLAQIARAGGARRRTGQLHASIYYAAPEMLAEEGAPSETTDQYSLALTYYHLRTGALPFREEDQHELGTLLRAHTEGRLDLSKLPQREQKVIKKATALNPKKRYKSCQDMVRELKVDQRRWWQDWGVAIALGTILLSALVGTLFALQGLWWGPQKRLEQLVASWNDADLSCETVHEQIVDYRDQLGGYEELKAFAVVRDRAVQKERQLLQKVLGKTAAWMDVPHTSCPETVDDLGTLLGMLVRETSTYTALNWDARFLQVRHDARRIAHSAGRADEEQDSVDDVVKRIAGLRDEANRLAENRAEGLPQASHKLVLLDALELALTHSIPVEKTPETLKEVFVTLEEVAALSDRAVQISEDRAGSETADGAWTLEESWENRRVRDLKGELYAYFEGYERWWARDRKTPRREQLLRQVFGSKADGLLPDPNDELGEFLANAADLRREGVRDEAERNLRFARALLSEQDPEARTLAQERIDLEELALWLSAPDVYHAELAHPGHRHSLAAPVPNYDLWRRACNEVSEKARNALVNACSVESRLHLAEADASASVAREELLKQASEAATRAGGDAAWYADYAQYVQGLVLAERGQRGEAALKLIEAYDRYGPSSRGGETEPVSVVGTNERRGRAARVLFDAAEAAILQMLTREGSTRSEAEIPEVVPIDLLNLPVTEIERTREFLRQAKELIRSLASQHQLPPEHQVYDLVIDFSLSRQSSTAGVAWQALASRAEELIGNAKHKAWEPSLHLIAADAIHHGLTDSTFEAEALRRGVEHYSRLLETYFDPNGVLEVGDPVDAYEQVVAPAVEMADSLRDASDLGGGDEGADDGLRVDLAIVYCTQGMLIRKDVQVRTGLDSAAELALAALHRSNQLHPTVRTLLEEGYALAEVGGSPKDLAKELQALAERAASIASAGKDQVAAHGLKAYALIHEARIVPPPANRETYREAIREFESAVEVADKLRTGADDEEFAADYARLSTGLSTSLVEYGVAARPSTGEWMQRLRRAAELAEHVIEEFPDRNDKHVAWIVWGNALEDMALYCDDSVEDRINHFEAAIERFEEAARRCAEAFFGGFPHATANVSLARCRVRRVNHDALPPRTTKDAELTQARAELVKAIGWLNRLKNSSVLERYSAEAHYLLGKAVSLQSTDAGDAASREQVVAHWERAAAAVEQAHPHHWAVYKLELARHAWEQNKYRDAAGHALAVLRRVNHDESSSPFISPQQVRNAIAIAIAAHPDLLDEDLVRNVEQAASKLDTRAQAEIFAEKCAYGLTNGGKERLAQCRADLEQAESRLEELTQKATNERQDLTSISARLETARGLLLYTEALAAAGRSDQIKWEGQYAHLKQAAVHWNALRDSPELAATATASQWVTSAIRRELSLYVKKVLVRVNAQLLFRAENSTEWDSLTNEVQRLLDATDPQERRVLEDWESMKNRIRKPE